MKHVQVKTWFLIPSDCFKGQESFNKLILSISLLALSGCVTTGKSEPLAPSPPSVASSSFSAQQSHIPYQPHYFSAPMQVALLRVDTAPITESSLGVPPEINAEYLPLKGASSSSSKCGIKDRFDRKAILAYEWGRSRLALDVDGLNLSGGSERAIRLEYKMRFQPEKTKKQRCRYSSSWQGLIGSGYHELFVREEDTVWEEAKDVKRSVMQYVNRVF
ncbi:MAG: hypothetical protein COA45_01325 [Zetaproteobacteria bacterium]|nr:MAG: hypothetical protein COA45_01325 [Zetaproteobacteria bacterium]